MSAEKYIYQKNKKAKKRTVLSLFIVSLFFFLILGTSCFDRRIWNIPLEEVTGRLANGDYSFLEKIDFKKHKIDEALKIEPGAPFFLGAVFSSLGRDDLASSLYKSGWQRLQGQWKFLTGESWLSLLLEKKYYVTAEKLADRFIGEYPGFERIDEIKKAYIEALYWQKKDLQVLKSLEVHFPREPYFDPELLLFKTVSSYRAHRPGWKNSFLKLFIKVRGSDLHLRGYKFFYDSEDFEGFSEAERRILYGKYYLVAGKRDEGIEELEAGLKELPALWLENNSIIKELGFAYQYSGKYLRGVKFLLSLEKKVDGPDRLSLLEMVGRLYLKGGYLTLARNYLFKVFEETLDADQKDRTLWFYLEGFKGVSIDSFFTGMLKYRESWNDFEYFSDHLNYLISGLVSKGAWKELWKLYQSIHQFSSYDVTRRLEYVLYRIFSLKYLKVDRAEELLDRLYGNLVKKSDPPDYYSILSGYLRGEEQVLFEEHPTPASGEKVREIDSFIEGFFRYGLIEDGLSRISGQYKNLKLKTIIRGVKEFYIKEDYIKGISLIQKFIGSRNPPLGLRDYYYLYPVAYSENVEAVAKRENFYPFYLYSLIYKESAFKADIDSGAGAVGLTQLMAGTAEDMAWLLRLKEYSLVNPDHNISLGGKYLGKLFRLFESIPMGLGAYNAGMGRMRKWQKEFAALPGDLFVEAIPYPETRAYVQKVIEASLFYGYLYYDQSFSKIVKQIYPELR